jgi:hypothetical protein
VRLHVIYRSTSGENRKPRPEYYSKLECLYSLLRAREACPDAGDLVFVNDGRLPADRLEPMLAAGEVHAYEGMGMRRSYVRALREADRADWAGDDLVFLVEDDYLHRPEALLALASAARELPGADYLGTYGTLAGAERDYRALEGDMRRPRLKAEPPRDAGGTRWLRGLSTTFTFAARVRTLRRDRPLHAVTPRLGGAFDHALGLAYQGRLPYRARDLTAAREGVPRSRRHKPFALRMAVSAAAVGYRVRPRTLLIADPALSAHVETGYMPPGTEWRAVGEAAAAWAHESGLHALNR